MLFDSSEAERLYHAYIQTGNVAHTVALHLLSVDLIKVIAGSLNQHEHFDDLVQEGHLKLQHIIINQSYRLGTRCSMYTFLSYCLRNAMIDHLRKLKPFDPLDDSMACTKCLEAVWDDTHFDYYYGQRFPSLGAAGVELTAYIRDTIMEQAPRVKVISTVTDVHGLQRCQANLLHNSVSLFLKLSMRTALDTLGLDNSLSYAHNGSEMTLKPESVLAGNPLAAGYKELLLSVHKL